MMEVIVTARPVDAHVFPLLAEHHHLRVDWLEVEVLSVTHERSSPYHSPCNLRAMIECMMLEHVRRAMSCLGAKDTLTWRAVCAMISGL